MNEELINNLRKALVTYPIDKAVKEHHIESDRKKEVPDECDNKMRLSISDLIDRKDRIREKLANKNSLNTLGDYIRNSRLLMAYSINYLANVSGYDANKLNSLEQDKVLPLDMPASTLAIIVKEIRLNFEWLEELIHKSCSLMMIDKGNSGMALARSKKGDANNLRHSAVTPAMKELRIKGRAKRGLTLDDTTKSRIKKYIGEVKYALGK